MKGIDKRKEAKNNSAKDCIGDKRKGKLCLKDCLSTDGHGKKLFVSASAVII